MISPGPTDDAEVLGPYKVQPGQGQTALGQLIGSPGKGWGLEVKPHLLAHRVPGELLNACFPVYSNLAGNRQTSLLPEAALGGRGGAGPWKLPLSTDIWLIVPMSRERVPTGARP